MDEKMINRILMIQNIILLMLFVFMNHDNVMICCMLYLFVGMSGMIVGYIGYRETKDQSLLNSIIADALLVSVLIVLVVLQ